MPYGLLHRRPFVGFKASPGCIELYRSAADTVITYTHLALPTARYLHYHRQELLGYSRSLQLLSSHIHDQNFPDP